jgi:hypothetical protein
MGAVLTRTTIWLALMFYVASEWTSIRGCQRRHPSVARALNATGFLLFLMHVGLAFHSTYHWSHATAYSETARQTNEMTGVDFGGGLYVNYVFGLIWFAEVVWQNLWPDRYSNRPKAITWSVRIFFLFMMINGTFVFVHNHFRWLGLTLCLLLAVCWLGSARAVDSKSAGTPS